MNGIVARLMSGALNDSYVAAITPNTRIIAIAAIRRYTRICVLMSAHEPS